MRRLLVTLLATVLYAGAYGQETEFIDGVPFDGNRQALGHKLEFNKKKDGPFVLVDVGGYSCVKTTESNKKHPHIRYLYATITDEQFKTTPIGEVELSIVYHEKGHGVFMVHYDSMDESAPNPAFKTVGPFRVKNRDKMVVSKIKLTDAKFKNNTNGCDLRLLRNVTTQPDLAVEGIYIRKVQ